MHLKQVGFSWVHMYCVHVSCWFTSLILLLTHLYSILHDVLSLVCVGFCDWAGVSGQLSASHSGSGLLQISGQISLSICALSHHVMIELPMFSTSTRIVLSAFNRVVKLEGWITKHHSWIMAVFESECMFLLCIYLLNSVECSQMFLLVHNLGCVTMSTSLSLPLFLFLSLFHLSHMSVCLCINHWRERDLVSSLVLSL